MSFQTKIRDTFEVDGIRLRKEGDYFIVDVEIDKAWIEMIRERINGNCIHIIKPSGVQSCYCRTFGEVDQHSIVYNPFFHGKTT